MSIAAIVINHEVIGIYLAALTHIPQTASQHIGAIFSLGIANALVNIKAPIPFGNSGMIVIGYCNIGMNIISLELLHNAFYALLRLGMAAEQAVLSAAALLRQVIQLLHRNQHGIRIKAGLNRVVYALFIGTALVRAAITSKQRLLGSLHQA